MTVFTSGREHPLVLVVDDDPSMRLLVRESLEQAGFATEEAEDGAPALVDFERLQPDIVMLDVNMPGMDGFTMCAELRRIPAGNRTPVLMMTGLDDVASINRAYEMGATDFITKPINWAVLGHRVRYILRASQAFEDLRKSQQSLANAQRIARLGNWDLDIERNRLCWSDVVYEVFGTSKEHFALSYEAFVKHVHPLDRERVRNAYDAALMGTTPLNMEHRIIRVDGQVRFVHECGEMIFDQHGKPIKLAGTLQDITERKRTEEALQESEEQFRQLAGNIPEVFWITNAEQDQLIYLSPAYEKIWGRALQNQAGSPHGWRDSVHPDDRSRVIAALKNAPLGEYAEEYRVIKPDGTVCWVHDRAFPVTNQQGQIYRIAGIVKDITEQKEIERRLLNLAHYDSLTQLPNRNLLQDRLQQALVRARRGGHSVAALFLDLDRFKMVNDSLGHDAGDALLKTVAERLRACVRAEDTVARLGGDEFIIVIEEVTGDDAADTVAHKVLAAIQAPFMLQEQTFTVNTSIGVSVFPRDGENAQALLKNADTALYRAKEQGRGRIQFYTAGMNARAVERLTLEQALAQALERGELLLNYQPQVELRTGRMIGVEALLRWRHPTLGMVPPAKFIPLAEEAGLMVPIGEWVLRQACAQTRAWQAAGLAPLTVAVNLSVRQFIQSDLPSRVAAILKETGLPPNRLELEITETQLMKDVTGAIDTLRAFKAMGVRLAIDDFGTGYSSLNYLKRFPIDRLKIAHDFVRDITTDPNDAAIAVSVIAMAYSLKLGVIAEGVETRAQLAFLRAKGCDEIQGYCFSPPLSAEAMTALLQDDRRLQLDPAQERGQRTLLIVDDEANILYSLKRVLHGEGYRVLTACNAKEALESLARNHASVVVSDHLMPGMSGIEFLARVRELYPQTVRVLLSGRYDTTTLTEAINDGAVYKFVSKPVASEELRSILREAFLLQEAQSRPKTPTHASLPQLQEAVACALQP